MIINQAPWDFLGKLSFHTQPFKRSRMFFFVRHVSETPTKTGWTSVSSILLGDQHPEKTGTP